VKKIMGEKSHILKGDAYKTILDSIADGVFTVDDEWRIISWNRAAEQITGFPATEAVGHFCYNVFRTNVCQSDCVLRKTIRSGRDLINVPINILCKDGEEKPVSISTAVLRNSAGDVIGGVETFRDLAAIETLRKALTKQYSFQDIISKNHRMMDLFQVLPDISESDSTVLIQGASGTGKELFARAIHNLSPRRERSFIAINCAALPDTLLESELFGYRRGAFTDARQNKPGRFDAAQGGTIFLDEIGDISLSVQIKLLRVLQEKLFEPLGGTSSVKADVRVVAATNKDLKSLMARGRFRDDLFYRLNVICLNIPPLADRMEDIPLLVDHLIARFNAEKGKNLIGITPETMSILMGYHYPGNIRELENIIERACILCKGSMLDIPSLPREIFPPELETAGRRLDVEDLLAAAEAKAILQALAQYQGHRAKTAKALGIHRTTLIRKMKKLSITYN
jgi:PAS domain S-box-containing protein